MSDDSTTDTPKRSPVYHVFELQRLLAVDDPDDLETGGQTEYVEAWVQIGGHVNANTDRKAIEEVIGTAEDPMPNFDEDRRLGTFVAVLTRHWEPRKRKRVVHEDWA